MDVLAAAEGQDETERDKTRQNKTKTDKARCWLLGGRCLAARRCAVACCLLSDCVDGGTMAMRATLLLLGLKGTIKKYNRVKSITKHYKALQNSNKKVTKSKKH